MPTNPVISSGHRIRRIGLRASGVLLLLVMGLALLGVTQGLSYSVIYFVGLVSLGCCVVYGLLSPVLRARASYL